MIRKQTAVLSVDSVVYALGDGLELALSRKEDRIAALTSCDSKGRFSILGYQGKKKYEPRGPYQGRITRIGFEGSRKLTGQELEGIHHKLDDKSTVELVEFSFEQWQREGRPLKVRLNRREEYVDARV